ncbi:hypothetical protein BDA99DRAFT_524262 [Phascolomyces articulosus]|uniref:Uncharacterized protein n=1 Tax=Phascolomyces articulosus TaxID=60185 RepID=A0AAD5K090_9FUNG|nr:hypothetical protein BDA99DRAFT_524262 [Phascolomyces articulosus]
MVFFRDLFNLSLLSERGTSPVQILFSSAHFLQENLNSKGESYYDTLFRSIRELVSIFGLISI